MEHPSFTANFPRQLRFWSFHCLLNALPSFAIALFLLNMWTNPTAIAAMLSAIGTFAVVFAALTSLPGPISEKKHALSRALVIGTKIRAMVSFLSLIMIPYRAFMFTPDFWCGLAAAMLLNSANQFAGFEGTMGVYGNPDAGFFPVFATTLLEGVILSVILLMISFVALVFVQARDRRRFLAGEIQGHSGHR